MSERRHRYVLAPVCVRCALCGLSAEDGDRGVHQIEISYGDGELTALTRWNYVCVPCIQSLSSSPK